MNNIFLLSLTLLCASVFLPVTELSAQVYPFADTENVGLTDVRALYDDGELTGYAMIGKEVIVEKKGSKSRSKSKNKRTPSVDFVIELMDADLNSLGKTALRGKQTANVRSVAYNGDLLAVEFLDAKEKRKYVLTFNGAGEQVRRQSVPFLATDAAATSANLEAMGYASLEPVPGGFLHIGNGTEGKLSLSKSGFKITYIANDAEIKPWYYRSPRDVKDFRAVKLMAAADSIAVVAVATKEGLFNDRGKAQVIGINTRTGKEAWKYELDTDENPVNLANGRIINGKIHLVGFDVGRSGKIWTDAPEAVDKFVFDPSGKLESQQRLFIEQAMATELPVAGGARIKGLGKLWIHDFAINLDGQVLMAGEFYKNFNGSLTFLDGISVVLDQDFEVMDVALIDKGKSKDGGNLNPGGGLSLTKGSKLAMIAKSRGAFGFGYLQQTGNRILTVYTNGSRDRRKIDKAEAYFHVLTNGELKTDILSFSADKGLPWLLPAKAGFILIGEREESGRLGLRMEKLAY